MNSAGKGWRRQAGSFRGGPGVLALGAQLDDYTGTYGSDEIEPLYSIRLENGGLVLHRLRNKPDVLHPVRLDLFSGSIGSIRFTPQQQRQSFRLYPGYGPHQEPAI